MLNDLMQKYIDKFKDDITLNTFLDLEEQEQIKILTECLEQNKRIYENAYFNDNYMEKNI